MRIVAAFILVLVSAAAAAGEDGKRLIWGNIPLVKAGNYYEFDAELSRTRATARGEALARQCASHLNV